jgi:hypothetical protein
MPSFRAIILGLVLATIAIAIVFRSPLKKPVTGMA